MRLWFLLVVLALSTQDLPVAQSNAPPRSLRVERSPMILRASGVSYDGVTRTGISPERFAEMRTSEYWTEARSDGVVFFRGGRVSLDSEGLGVYRLGDDRWRTYPMFGLAVAAGWYQPRPDDRPPLGDIRGLALGGSKVWMGTSGVGIIALDLRDGTWSRHDGQATPVRGVHSEVLYADDDYLFVGTAGQAPDVYSLRRNAWLRLRGIPRENVLEFGWTDYPAVSIRCDTRPMRWRAEVPLEFCTMPVYVRSVPDQAGYELGREFNQPGAPFRFTVSREELERAFNSMQ